MIHPNSFPWGRPYGRPHTMVLRPGRARAQAARREQRAERRPWSRRKLWKTVFACVALAGMTCVAAGIVGAYAMVHRLLPTIPTVSQIAAFQPATATTIYSSDGVLLAELNVQNREPVPLDKVSPALVSATLAVEDNRFYQHSGVDYRGIARAAAQDLLGEDSTAQGASTITQQLARNISQFGIGKEKTLRRKLREAMTAMRMEQVFDKNEILALYLNQIYYGSGAYGVEAAARTYFGKSAKDLTLPEAALLAGLPRSPNAYSPYRSLAAAKDRRNVVLKRMLDTGRITDAQYKQACAAPIHLAGRSARPHVYRAPYFVDWVVRDLVKRYGVDAVYSGWKVVTTLDWGMQRRAEQAVRDGLTYGATQGALVSLDPHTGEVRAMVGGVDYDRDQFNIVTQGKRQPGSAFKPIVYAAALDTGAVSLESTYPDQKVEIPNGRRTWTVHDYGSYSDNDETVLDAIVHSTNTVAVQTAQDVGIDQVIAYAHRMGITTDLAPYLPLALGASAVRPIELCTAYGIFAAGGALVEPTGVRSITDNAGRPVALAADAARHIGRVLQPSTVTQMNVALRAVVTRGTGTAANVVPNAFGKTGTTDDERDAWFVGYTPELATAVWVGHPARDIAGQLIYEPLARGATGGHAAAPMWARFMQQAVPIQQRANARRGQPPWSITLPPPPPQPEATISLDMPDEGGWTGGAQSYADAPIAADPATTDGAGSAAYQVASARPSDGSGSVVYLRPRSGGQYAAQQPTQAQPPSAPRATYAGFGGPAQPGSSSHGHHMVAICVDSGQRATEWCPTTVLVDADRMMVPSGHCHMHHAPPGEGR